jgi:nitrogen-specific signal transduction histidine kinase
MAQMAGVLFDGYRRSFREQHLEQQLQQSHKMEALGRLAGGIAHDFNNLLTIITGYSDLSDVPTAEALAEIRAAASRAAALVSQLLAFSRRRVIRPRRVDLNAVVNGTAGMLRRTIGEHVAIALDLDDTVASVEADPHQIEQVLVNLAVNARDAMPKGGALTIRMRSVSRNALDPAHRLAQSSEQERFVLLRVRDTGEGMDEQTRAHIFEPFFTTKELGRGTGLGLSTVYGIVQQHGGTIRVESAIGEGSVFEICLPWSDGPLAPLEPELGGPSALTGTETILVVEDEPQLLALVVRALREHGYAVIEANNPVAALHTAREHRDPIDLVVSDIVMPQMNGVVLVEYIKVFHPETRVCFMSGYSQHGNDILRAGAVLLEKPFTPVTLLTTVRQVLDRRASGSADQ